MTPWARSPVARFFEKVLVDRETDCWIWIANRTAQGYGQFYAGPLGEGSKMMFTHRWCYEFFHGKIAEGMTLDHLCENKPCVNPLHMEVVTRAENTRRGQKNRRRSNLVTCKRGHRLTPENVIIPPDGRRRCRICKRLRERDFMRSKRAAA